MVRSPEEFNSFHSQSTEGKFSIDGLALDDEAKIEAIGRYQKAIDIASDELVNLQDKHPGVFFYLFIAGSIQDLRSFRFGIYDVRYSTYAKVSENKLAQSMYAGKQNNLPSDLDIFVRMCGDVADFYNDFEDIEKKVFWQTGVLVDIHPDLINREKMPISQLINGGFKKIASE